jgi:hypothetical protein
MMSVRELGMSEHRDALAWAEAQVAASLLDERPGIGIGLWGYRAHAGRAGSRTAHGVQHRAPEHLRLAVIALYRNPNGALRDARFADPGAQQIGLAAACRRRHFCHPARSTELLEQLATEDDACLERRSLGTVGRRGLGHETVNFCRDLHSRPPGRDGDAGVPRPPSGKARQRHAPGRRTDRPGRTAWRAHPEALGLELL